jgi:hypothetical protein
VPSGGEVSEIVEMRRAYNKAKAESFKKFNEEMEHLETLMRQHIAGKVDSSSPTANALP